MKNRYITFEEMTAGAIGLAIIIGVGGCVAKMNYKYHTIEELRKFEEERTPEDKQRLKDYHRIETPFYRNLKW